MGLKWTDSREIAIALLEAHPGRRPRPGPLHRPVQLGARVARFRRRSEALRREDPGGDPDGVDRRGVVAARWRAPAARSLGSPAGARASRAGDVEGCRASLAATGAPMRFSARDSAPMSPAPMPAIAALYAGLIGLLLLALAARISGLRRQRKIGLGDGGDPLLLRAIRAHGNTVEWGVPAIVLLLVADLTRASPGLAAPVRARDRDRTRSARHRTLRCRGSLVRTVHRQRAVLGCRGRTVVLERVGVRAPAARQRLTETPSPRFP